MLPFLLLNCKQLTCHHHRDADVPHSVFCLLTPPMFLLAAASHVTSPASPCLLAAVSGADTAVSPHRYRPGSRAHRHTAKPAVTHLLAHLAQERIVN